MKTLRYGATLFLFFAIPCFAEPTTTLWSVIGAGPAGILTVGLLMDLGVQAKDITWIDEEFNVGRLGKYYTTVPANLKSELFVQFLNDCKTFQQCPTTPAIEKLHAYDPKKEYPLETIVRPLQDITHYLRQHVRSKTGLVTALDHQDDDWLVQVGPEQIRSSYVVLATGSHPRELNYPIKNKIPLDVALDKNALAKRVSRKDSIAVVGSAHSAVLIMKYLTELHVRRIVNFYSKPLVYVEDKGDWVAQESSGLKGITAWWAKNVLGKKPPRSIKRVKNTKQNRDRWLPLCNRIIYAIGYERNELPNINGSKDISYDASSGIIGPRLFGIGIAFPEERTDPEGKTEFRVGLPFFMEYAQRVIPQWLTKRSLHWLQTYQDLFTIDIL